MKSIFAATCLIISVCGTSAAEQIARDGPGHNGVRLHLKRVDLSDQGVSGTAAVFTIECRKNWGGRASGAASITAFPALGDSIVGEPKELTLKCSRRGGIDGATKKSKKSASVSFTEGDRVVYVVSLDRSSKDSWEVWGEELEKAARPIIRDVVRNSITGSVSSLMGNADTKGLISGILD